MYILQLIQNLKSKLVLSFSFFTVKAGAKVIICARGGNRLLIIFNIIIDV